VLITFSGLDGAGKTTLIHWLRTTLEQQDRSVAVYHMNDEVGLYAYARALRDRLRGQPRPQRGGGAGMEHPQASRSARTAREHRSESRLRQLRYTIVWNKPLRRLLYPVDLLIFLGYRLWIEGIQQKILVMDRYFYDSLVDVADDDSWGLLRLLERITPVPDVPIFLDVNPEVASRRKNEHTLAYLRCRWAAYREVFQWVGPTVKLTDLPLTAAQSALQQVLLVRLPSP
jgi:thymidylate kinase